MFDKSEGRVLPYMLDQLTLGQLFCLLGNEEEEEEITYEEACEMIEAHRKKAERK